MQNKFPIDPYRRDFRGNHRNLFKTGVFRPLTFEVVTDVFVPVAVSLVVRFSFYTFNLNILYCCVGGGC